MTFESGAAAVASAISGGGLFANGLYLRSKLRSCQGWAQTTGRVTESGVESDDGLQVCVTYEYTVNGTGYSNSRIQFGTPTTYFRKSAALAAISRYPVDCALEVYYNPENPAEAVLDRTSPSGLEYIICGVILLVMAVLVMLYPAQSINTSSTAAFPVGYCTLPNGLPASRSALTTRANSPSG